MTLCGILVYSAYMGKDRRNRTKDANDSGMFRTTVELDKAEYRELRIEHLIPEDLSFGEWLRRKIKSENNKNNR